MDRDGIEIHYEVFGTVTRPSCSFPPGRSSTPGSGRCRCLTSPVITGWSPLTAQATGDRIAPSTPTGTPSTPTSTMRWRSSTSVESNRPWWWDYQEAPNTGCASPPCTRARVRGLVMIGPALPLGLPAAGRERTEETFWQPYPQPPKGWDKYNLAYWHDNYRDFLEFFFAQGFAEPHSTKPIEDTVGWGLETGPEILEADSRRPLLGLTGEEAIAAVECPILVIHGTHDRIQSHSAGEKAARLSNGTFVSLEGAGHFPNVRDPVKVNLLLRDFLETGGVVRAAISATGGLGRSGRRRDLLRGLRQRGHHLVDDPAFADRPFPDLEGSRPVSGPSLPGGHCRREGKREVGSSHRSCRAHRR